MLLARDYQGNGRTAAVTVSCQRWLTGCHRLADDNQQGQSTIQHVVRVSKQGQITVQHLVRVGSYSVMKTVAHWPSSTRRRQSTWPNHSTTLGSGTFL